MKIILAVICFLSMVLHGLFGYYLFINGESVFEPDNMIVAIHKKTPSSPDIYSIFAKPKTSQKDDGFKNPFDKTDNSLTKVGEVTDATSSANPETSMTTEVAHGTEESEKTSHPMLPSGQVQVGTALAAASPTEIVRNQATDSVTTESSQPQQTEASEAKPEFLPFSTGWSGFLQVENALITVTLFLLGFSICCVKGRGPASRWVFFCNLIFWAALSAIIWFFHPEKTPFAMMNLKFKFPEWYLILGASGLATLLSLLLYLNAFRKPLDVPVKNQKALHEEGSDKTDVRSEPSRFGFKRRAEPKLDGSNTELTTQEKTPIEKSSSE